MNENIALDKSFQSKFSRKVKKVRERVRASGDIVQNTSNQKVKPEHGVIYIGHIPHGFYENEMLAYFKQFGKVSNLRICRSRATGRSKGYGFVEFASAEVAKIAAETMDNYLMFNRRLIAKFISHQKPSQRRYKGQSWSEKYYPLKDIRQEVNKQKNKFLSDDEHLKKSKKMIAQVNRSLKKLKELGINYSFRAVDDANNLNANIVQANTSENIKTDIKEESF
ncbi:hypothetical protein ILUMI_27481 [Ignelater luminosus]|uniref:RRM domain-containing protein n=1 Tax=Ignelater luminosus TaxID=2038154 RepID=A0A8K0C623_IGNLU|nr:hypothetical protein ILUMI_27481 [Ignelater luminosus]